MLVVTFVVGTLHVPKAQGQTGADGSPEAFEVASVKANASGEVRSSLRMNLPDGFSATNQTLPSLISFAYQIPLDKITGRPAWLASARFDINAKADHRITNDEKRAMLRRLLDDRFHLRVRRDTHEGRIYALRVSRADRTLGPDLKASDLDCTAILAERQRTAAPPPPPTAANPIPACGLMMGTASISAHGIQLASFAASLGSLMRETVVDETGLSGWWDLTVAVGFRGFGGPAAGGPDQSSDQPSIFTALEEQLGLKLEPRRGPIETLVIEHVEPPQAD